MIISYLISDRDEDAPNVCRICGHHGYLGVHLRNERNDRCRVSYCLLLELDETATAQQVMEERIRRRRKEQPSRTNERRKAEGRNRMLKQHNNMDLLQNFFKETSQPATVFTCFQCDRVRSRRNMESIKRCEARDKIDYTYEREDAFWRCINCKNEQISQYKDEGPWIHMTTVNVENRKISKPITEEGETRTTIRSNFLLPTSCSALKRAETATEPHLRPDIVHKIQSTPGKLDLDRFPVDVIENQTRRLKDSLLPTGILRGEILDYSRNKIRLKDDVVNTSRVKGSDDYYERLENELKFTIMQEGSALMVVKTDLPKETDCAMATALMQVNTHHIEKRTEDNKTNYFVHPHPNARSACTENCSLLMNLDEFVEKEGYNQEMLTSGAFLTSATSCVKSRSIQLKTLILKGLKSPKYFSTVQFPTYKRNAELVVACWPTELDNINKMIANKDEINEDGNDTLAKLIDGRITATLNKTQISLEFDLTDSIASEAVELATSFQHDICEDRAILSNITMTKEQPTPPEGEEWSLVDKMTLLENYEEVRKEFNTIIDVVEMDNFETTSTATLDDLLEELRDQDGFSLVKDGKFFRLTFPNTRRIFNLLADDVLLKLIENKNFSHLSAIYHRAWSITDSSKIEVVLRRPYLRDAYVKQYNPVVLLAAKAKTSIDLVVTEDANLARDLVSAQNSLPDELDGFGVDFREVSLEEGIWITDPQKKLFSRDPVPLYIGIKSERTRTFREAKFWEAPENYVSIVDGKEYELVRDIYDIYLDRIGLKTLCFKQVLKRYLKGKDVEERVDELDHNDEVPGAGEQDEREVNYVVTCTDDETNPPIPLPEVILSNKGEKLILKSRSRVITHKTPNSDSEEFMFLNLVLFYPHTSEDEMKLETRELETLFHGKDRDPVRNGEGHTLTKIETVKARLEPRQNQDLWKLFFDM